MGSPPRYHQLQYSPRTAGTSIIHSPGPQSPGQFVSLSQLGGLPNVNVNHIQPGQFVFVPAAPSANTDSAGQRQPQLMHVFMVSPPGVAGESRPGSVVVGPPRRPSTDAAFNSATASAAIANFATLAQSGAAAEVGRLSASGLVESSTHSTQPHVALGQQPRTDVCVVSDNRDVDTQTAGEVRCSEPGITETHVETIEVQASQSQQDVDSKQGMVLRNAEIITRTIEDGTIEIIIDPNLEGGQNVIDLTIQHPVIGSGQAPSIVTQGGQVVGWAEQSVVGNREQATSITIQNSVNVDIEALSTEGQDQDLSPQPSSQSPTEESIVREEARHVVSVDTTRDGGQVAPTQDDAPSV